MFEFINRLNPLSHTSSDQYNHFWQLLFSTMLEGFWGRFLAFTLLLLSFWFGVRRRNYMLGMALFAMSLCITYGAPLMHLTGLL